MGEGLSTLGSACCLFSRPEAVRAPAETRLHPDVRGALCGRGLLRLPHPGSDPGHARLPNVCGLMGGVCVSGGRCNASTS